MGLLAFVFTMSDFGMAILPLNNPKKIQFQPFVIARLGLIIVDDYPTSRHKRTPIATPPSTTTVGLFRSVNLIYATSHDYGDVPGELS